MLYYLKAKAAEICGLVSLNNYLVCYLVFACSAISNAIAAFFRSKNVFIASAGPFDVELPDVIIVGSLSLPMPSAYACATPILVSFSISSLIRSVSVIAPLSSISFFFASASATFCSACSLIASSFSASVLFWTSATTNCFSASILATVFCFSTSISAFSFSSFATSTCF